MPRIESDKERARRALVEAQQLGDAEAISLATEAVAKTSYEAQNAQRLIAQQKNRPQQSQPAAPQQRKGQPAAPDRAAEAGA